ncbi:PHP domain-containing protein [Caproiciproducens faecalis]|uniref:PHP domain-containing protein n=1 Tax=Caproiciproducens faecalis TaxID=2820301 RepID=A0ABS7DMU3_9FIRM|nr:PHP domain-containing protein [Caproiciproducens faecalis]MBW7572543.1 PHP domain-containing protein [Caproiciproducens faecalis]
MNRVYYDLHLHSCLSPCGSDDMTPNNIVNMALLLGYNMIAVTDHNSCRNTPAAVKAGAKNGLPVVPGMELCTQEEAHVICLFPTVEAALAFGRYVEERMPKIRNRPEIFGRQTVMDEQDTVIGEEEALLLNASSISVNRVQKLVRGYGGTAFPAHVDKSAYSVISNLGFLPPEAEFTAAEISEGGDVKSLLLSHPELNDKIFLKNSDAHYLENMTDASASVLLPEKTPECLIAALNREIQTEWDRG